MNVKIKTTMMIVVTLIIGILIGALLNRALLQNRLRKALSMRTPHRLVSFYERAIRPDPAQSERLREILSQHAYNISKILENSREKMRSEFESMREELDAILTPEQKKRLERGLQQFPAPPHFPFRPRFGINIDLELSMLKERLGLSPGQALEVRKILEKTRDQVEKIRGERRGQRASWRAFQGLEEEKEKAIESLLTDDQKRVYGQIRKERRKMMGEGARKGRHIMKNR